MNNVDPRQVSKIMKSALGNPFEQKDFSGEPTSTPVSTSGLSSEEREVVAAIQDGITDPEAIALNTRLTLAEVKKIAESLKSKGRMAEVGTNSNSVLADSPIARMSNPAVGNATSSALRNNSGISGKSSIFVPKTNSANKLKLF